MNRLTAAIIVVFELLIVGACDETADVTTVIDQSPPTVAKDNSLTVAGYIDLGVPSPDREWLPADYARAAGALASIAAEDSHKLPRVRNSDSAPVIRRIVAWENVVHVFQNSRTKAEEVLFLSEVLKSTNKILITYFDSGGGGEVFDEEVLKIAVFTLEVQGEMTVRAIPFAASFGPDDPHYATRMEGLAQTKRGLTQAVDGVITILTERGQYRVEVLVDFASEMARILPRLFPILSDQTRHEYLVRLRSIENRENDPGLRNALANLISSIDREVQP